MPRKRTPKKVTRPAGVRGGLAEQSASPGGRRIVLGEIDTVAPDAFKFDGNWSRFTERLGLLVDAMEDVGRAVIVRRELDGCL